MSESQSSPFAALPSGPVPAGFSCSTAWLSTPAGSVAVLRVRGDVDPASLPVLRRALDHALDRCPTDVIVDLTGTTVTSADGLRLLVHTRRHADARGIDYVLSGVSDKLQDLMVQHWQPAALPAPYPTTASAVADTMARHTQRRRRVDRAVHRSGRPHLRLARDPERFDGVDEQTINDRAGAGDPDTYQELVRRHRTLMYRSALYALGSPATHDAAVDATTADLHDQLRAALTAFD